MSGKVKIQSGFRPKWPAHNGAHMCARKRLASAGRWRKGKRKEKKNSIVFLTFRANAVFSNMARRAPDGCLTATSFGAAGAAGGAGGGGTAASLLLSLAVSFFMTEIMGKKIFRMVNRVRAIFFNGVKTVFDYRYEYD